MAAEDETYFYRDVESFEKPFDQAIEDSKRTFLAASRRVAGAESRTRVAVDELRALREFAAAVEERLRTRSFHTLPGLRRGRERLDGYHHLTVGPWRGVFLVAPDRTRVVGVLFSKAPHRLEARFDEIARAYRAQAPTPLAARRRRAPRPRRAR